MIMIMSVLRMRMVRAQRSGDTVEDEDADACR